MKKYILILLGSLLFTLFLFNFGFKNIENAFHSIQVIYALPILLLNIPVLLLKTWRWKLLLARFDINLGFRTRFTTVSSGYFLGLVTPGTVGELARSVNIKIDQSKSIGTILFEKYFDLISLVILAITGLLMYYGGLFITALVIVSIVIFLSTIHFIIIRKPLLVNNLIFKLLHKLSAKNKLQYFSSIYSVAISLFCDIKLLFISTFTSFTLWIITGAQFYLVLKALAVEPSLVMILICCFVPYLASIISFIPLGLGVLDFSMVGLASYIFGISESTAYLAAVSFRLTATLPLVLWGYSVYIFSLFIRSKNHRKYETNISIQNKS